SNCNGDIRLKKITDLLKNEGFDNDDQHDDGEATYSKDPVAKGQLWDGQMYVFDERLTVPINQVEHVVVGRDHFDGEPCERYINCANPVCNAQILASEENQHYHLGGCSIECAEHPRNRYIVEHNMTSDFVKERIEELKQTDFAK